MIRVAGLVLSFRGSAFRYEEKGPEHVGCSDQVAVAQAVRFGLKQQDFRDRLGLGAY